MDSGRGDHRVPARRTGLTEKQFQAQVTDLCGWLGLRYYHTHDSRRSPEGFPDLVIVGRATVFVELKSEGGRLTRAQRAWIEDLRTSGQKAYIWRPGDWEWVQQILFDLSWRKVGL